MIIICKKYYVDCIRNELKLDDLFGDRKDHTYEYIQEDEKSIISKHKSFMTRNKIIINENMYNLPLLYWIPKMHKSIPKQRYLLRRINVLQKYYPL